jgi:hypothetical protein
MNYSQRHSGLQSRMGSPGTGPLKELHFERVSGILFSLNLSEITPCKQAIVLLKHKLYPVQEISFAKGKIQIQYDF